MRPRQRGNALGTSEIFHATFDEHLKVAHETVKLLENDFSSLVAACARPWRAAAN